MPPLMMVENASRSIARVIARRSSGLSKGGLWMLISIVRGTFTPDIAHTACGACSLKSFKVGGVTP